MSSTSQMRQLRVRRVKRSSMVVQLGMAEVVGWGTGTRKDQDLSSVGLSPKCMLSPIPHAASANPSPLTQNCPATSHFISCCEPEPLMQP